MKDKCFLSHSHFLWWYWGLGRRATIGVALPLKPFHIVLFGLVIFEIGALLYTLVGVILFVLPHISGMTCTCHRPKNVQAQITFFFFLAWAGLQP
jgi:hypothetical protein